VASRVRPGSLEYQKITFAVIAGDPVALPTPVIGEIFYGLFREDKRRPEFLHHARWLQSLLEDRIVESLPVTTDVAILAAEILAALPVPGARRPGDSRSKAEDRVSWHADILIAATAFVHGYDLMTRNVKDFERIPAAMPTDAPGDALQVHPPTSRDLRWGQHSWRRP